VQQQRPCRKFDAGTMCPSFRVTRDEATAPAAAPTPLRRRCQASWRPRRLLAIWAGEAMELCFSCKGSGASARPRRHGEDEIEFLFTTSNATATRSRPPDRHCRVLRWAFTPAAAGHLRTTRRAGAGCERMTGSPATQAASLPPRPLSPRRCRVLPPGAPSSRARSACAVRRHLRQLVRAGEPGRGGAACCRRGYRVAVVVGRRRPGAVLRPHLSRHGWSGRRAPKRSRHPRGAAAARGAGCRRGRAGAVVPAEPARRVLSEARRWREGTGAGELPVRGVRRPRGRTAASGWISGRCAHGLLHGHCHQKAFAPCVGPGVRPWCRN